jgi:hypothetical protein
MATCPEVDGRRGHYVHGIFVRCWSRKSKAHEEAMMGLEEQPEAVEIDPESDG